MPGPNQINPAQLDRLIGTPDAPYIIDVRIADDFALDPRVLPTSQRVSHTDIATTPIPSKRCVVLCQQGKKLSEGSAALLRLRGIAAETLAGGFAAWAKAKLPLTPAAILMATDRWVTRHRPKIDRIACPWLVRRFVNPNAQILYVPPSDVLDVADRFTAIPFDVPNTFWSHRNDQCTFDTMVTEFGLTSPALDRLSLVIRAADTDRHDLSPQAAGLLALSVGLSRQYKDDLDQLNAAMPLYDALYRWARDGFDEGHDWPKPPPGP
ncbi:chromate resistance protein ChrB domain-containing protein [Pseudorhodobacter ferrugineus]|uniref:chromate resistance protein ChrB domain-containing protein n=1 Tax=Pseudorhodobacter ferrugineus TaxID=77008 RepID=UPI0003B3B22D|nr:sulfurtransferase/chromate resistance protein [Pseudorhodobacter ferrugineus]